MKFDAFLKENEAAILAGWESQVLADYPADSLPFLKSKKDQFANPLGHTIRQGLADLLKAVQAEADDKVLAAALERILLLRAVEDHSPSQAVSFVFGLKPAVQAPLGKVEIEDFAEAWAVLEKKVESLVLMAFDIYMACRERLHQTRINELKSGRYILSDGAVCPSAMMRKEQEKSKGLQTKNTNCKQEAR